MKQIVYILSMGLLMTLRADAQTAATDNKVSESITFDEPPRGKDIYGVFEGRTPAGVSHQLGSIRTGSDLLKWQLIFYRDTLTGRPTVYTLTVGFSDHQRLKGVWKIVHGMKGDPTAIVYALTYGEPAKVLYLLKGDENVLFILDEGRDFLVGNRDLSYTLNRVHKVRRRPPGN
jgi:hypothetical protein